MRKFGLLSLIFLMFIPFGFAQENDDSFQNQETDGSLKWEEPEYEKFNNKAKWFNDWYIAGFAGGNLMQSADLNSFAKKNSSKGEGWFKPGFDFNFQVMKEVTHAVSLGVMGQWGNTHQFAYPGNWPGKVHPDAKGVEGITQYWGVSLIGDLNLSQLFRRMDNNSKFVWAWHAYAAAGFWDYKAKRRDIAIDDTPMSSWEVVDRVKFGHQSFYAQVGTGLRRKLSRHFDVELRAMYIFSGDEQFDGSGHTKTGTWTLADLKEDHDDNLITLSLGLHYKIGKHQESLQWVDPMKGLGVGGAFACPDEDNDGVCDLYDKCPGTPEGIAVDGSGCPLDSDKDGVPDSIDDCPTVPGPASNNGCPEPMVEVSIADVLTNIIQGIEFDFDKDVIRQVSYPKLDAAVDILKAYPDHKFYVEGHTDDAGSHAYNMDLSNRRAASVVKYLEGKGIPSDQLVPRGKGKTELKHPECRPTSKCEAWKNLENRRVIFLPYGSPIDGLEYKQ